MKRMENERINDVVVVICCETYSSTSIECLRRIIGLWNDIHYFQKEIHFVKHKNNQTNTENYCKLDFVSAHFLSLDYVQNKIQDMKLFSLDF